MKKGSKATKGFPTKVTDEISRFRDWILGFFVSGMVMIIDRADNSSLILITGGMMITSLTTGAYGILETTTMWTEPQLSALQPEQV